MDLQLIKNIITIGEEKSITKAAEKLFISQPALNQQLLNLEKHLGTRLFIRRRSEWTITEAGRIYIEAGKRILDIQKDAYAKIADVSEEKKEQLVIGATFGASDDMMAAIYAPIHDRYPNVSLLVHAMNGASVQQEILKNNLDIGVIPCSQERDPKLEYQIVADIPMYVVISAEDPVCILCREGVVSEPLSITIFKERKFLFGPADSLERKAINQVFAEAGQTPQDYEEIEGLRYRFSMVRADHCCTITGGHHVKKLPEGLRAYRLDTGARIHFAVVTRKNIYTSKYGKEVIKAIRKYWQDKIPSEEPV